VVFDFSVASVIDLETLTHLSWTSTYNGSFGGIACSVFGSSGSPYACAEHDSPGPESGRLVIQTQTSGSSIDPDGYWLRVNGSLVGNPLILGVNDRIELAMYPRSYGVALTDVASGCVVGGTQPVLAEIGSGETVTVDFSVTCP
jgi:hypothetical protein